MRVLSGAMTVAKNNSRLRLEGSGPRGIRSPWDQRVKPEQSPEKQCCGIVEPHMY